MSKEGDAIIAIIGLGGCSIENEQARSYNEEKNTGSENSKIFHEIFGYGDFLNGKAESNFPCPNEPLFDTTSLNCPDFPSL